MIGDGDSRTYKSVLDSNPYKEQGVRVRKYECYNHLLRNFGNRIVSASTVHLTNIPRGLIGLLRQFVKSRALVYRKAIVKLTLRRRHETPDENVNAQNLKQDIINLCDHGIHHHGKCKKLNIPCDKKKKDKRLMGDLVKKSPMYTLIKNALRDLSCHAISLLQNVTTNAAGSFFNITAKYNSGKCINFVCRDEYYLRCLASVVQFNSQQLVTKLYENNNLFPNKIIADLEKSKKTFIAKKRNIRSKRKDKNRRIPRDDGKDYGVNATHPEYSKEVYDNLVKELMSDLKKDQDNREQIEIDTSEQSNCDLWFLKKTRLLTASKFGSVCRKMTRTSCSNIVQSILYPNVLKTQSMQYGLQNEKKAL